MNCCRIIASLGCLVLLAVAATRVHGQGKKPAVKEIDAGTIAVYEKLGAEYGGWSDVSARSDFISKSQLGPLVGSGNLVAKCFPNGVGGGGARKAFRFPQAA